jgi:hypothetical protein
VLIWARGWLSEKVKEIADYGLKRLVRDVFGQVGWSNSIKLAD